MAAMASRGVDAAGVRCVAASVQGRRVASWLAT